MSPQFQDPMFDEGMGSHGGGVYDKEEAEFLKLVLDVDDVLDNFEHRVLRGEIRRTNPKTSEKYWEKPYDSKPPVNETGVREIMARILGRISKAAKLTYHTDEECYSALFYTDCSLAELFAKRCDAWDMNIETMKSIKDSCMEMIEDIIFSSRDGFTAINLKSSYSRSDVTRSDSQQTQSKGGFLSSVLGRKR